MREDEPRPSIDRELVARNAPAWRDGFFVVPKVIGGE
jgi:aspartyl/glutamyl-tRNA(Asn/Gln) amidotransferase C subunit